MPFKEKTTEGQGKKRERSGEGNWGKAPPTTLKENFHKGTGGDGNGGEERVGVKGGQRKGPCRDR